MDLLTMARGATLVSGAGDPARALGLIDGDPDDGSWRTDHPREVLPVSLVFELISPARLRAVGVDNAVARPGGVEGGAARSLRFEGTAEGPEEGYVALAALEAEPDARVVVPVSHPGPVRWIRVTVDTDHGGGTWVHLDEVIALGEAEPVPSNDGRFTGRFEDSRGALYDLAQAGPRLRGCYTGPAGRGSGSLQGVVEGGVARLEWVDGGTPAARGTALLVIDSRGWLSGAWMGEGGRAAVAAPRVADGPRPCPGASG